MKNNTQIFTLTDKDIEKMSIPNKKERFAASLYLGVRADRNYLAAANSLFTEENRKIEANQKFNHNDRKAIAAIFNDMQEKLTVLRLPDRTRSFIMFSDNLTGLRIYKTPVYIPSKIVAEKDFYIHPFIKNLQKYPHYTVVFLQRDRAKIYNYFWGEVADETEEIRSEVPQRMNAARADWKGLSESRILKHIDVHVDRHLKKVAEEADAYVRKNKIPHLIIGSHREFIDRFKEYLPAASRQKIAGSYLIRTDQSLKRIREKSLEAIGEFELEKENDIIAKLIEGSSKRQKMAVLGIKPVLESLFQYKIYTLVIGRNYAPEGYLSSANRHLYPEKNQKQACAVPIMPVHDLADELIEEAIARKIKIVHFFYDHPDFDKIGVGAILK